ncbi:MAG: cyclic 2,3-diphosphoglycerate synthase [candidate division WOR-3 bacterium]|jgi:predicted GTPase
MRKRVIIMGAAGMDYHAFNMFFKDNEEYEVVGFTMAAEQNLGTVGKLRTYPPRLAGRLYPDGIPTYYEKELPELIRRLRVDEVYFAYSDVKHELVMHRASEVLVAGARFGLLPPRVLQLKAEKPVVAVCAVRTGCGKSQTSRRVYEILQKYGRRVVAIREPMPYGDLEKQVWQRFASYEDLDRAGATIEEREEYEPYIEQGMVIYAGCDYHEILRRAQAEADVLVWDGGNNEISFYVPDLLIVLTDPLRAEHTASYHPGEVNLRMADVVVINKEDSAAPGAITKLKALVQEINPQAVIIDADSPLSVDQPERIRGSRVLVVEDGPTVTHGEMPYGAGRIAAERLGAREIIDPRPYARGTLAQELERSKHLDRVLPAMGYSPEQLRELEEAINRAECDLVVSGTPIDLSRLLKTNKPVVRVRYRLQEKSKPDLEEILIRRLKLQ